MSLTDVGTSRVRTFPILSTSLWKWFKSPLHTPQRELNLERLPNSEESLEEVKMHFSVPTMHVSSAFLTNFITANGKPYREVDVFNQRWLGKATMLHSSSARRLRFNDASVMTTFKQFLRRLQYCHNKPGDSGY
ncbi:protein kinase, putative [Anopheles sinensis]|uniref:Protein kinase, putative n=1 Tax=Anopheles sinensis TaxID=74873 RepID=A0A084WF68_ANOSI|nr:protein kinase, putative [Anopheles sinensis]